ncbi:MAG: histidinol-phosphate transaminase [Gammaproteobacteria bacterium]|nr:histidinol-phosphate transaminase [Gammaproteobacteria bacterium]
MTNRFIDLAASGLASLQPYVPGKPLSELEREFGITDSIKLASNENPLGPSPHAVDAIQAQLHDLTRYPDGGAFALRNALAAHHDVDPVCITVGNGSNDVLDMIARTFLGAGRESLFSQYAFAVYPLSSMAVGAKLTIAPAQDYGHDLDAMRALVNSDTGVIWIANPNNPSGTRVGRDALRAFIEDIPETVIVVVDEAYFEYVHADDYPDASQWLDEFPHLVVTRTFSKAYGLAALRVGYGLSHPDVADLLNRVRQPFNVDSLAQAGAIAALADREYLRRSVELNAAGMRQLVDGVERLGLAYIPSSGNFLTIDLGRESGPIDHALLQQGVITRPVGNYGLPHHLRVSVGLAYENERFLNALERVI